MTTNPTRCGSHCAISDGDARAESWCMQPPDHDGDHGNLYDPLRWPRLDQHDGHPIDDRPVTAS